MHSINLLQLIQNLFGFAAKQAEANEEIVKHQTVEETLQSRLSIPDATGHNEGNNRNVIIIGRRENFLNSSPIPPTKKGFKIKKKFLVPVLGLLTAIVGAITHSSSQPAEQKIITTISPPIVLRTINGSLVGNIKEILLDVIGEYEVESAWITNRIGDTPLLVQNANGAARLIYEQDSVPGAQILFVKYAGVKDPFEIPLNIAWELYSENASDGTRFDPLTYPHFKQLMSNETQFDPSNNAFIVKPRVVDLKNGSGIAVRAGFADPRQLEIECEIEVTNFVPHGGIQLSCQDKLSLQFLDGSLNLVSLKWRNQYISQMGQVTGTKRIQSNLISLSQLIETKKRLSFKLSRKDGLVKLEFAGSEYRWFEPHEIESYKLDEWSTISLRTYGSVMKIYRMSIK